MTVTQAGVGMFSGYTAQPLIEARRRSVAAEELALLARIYGISASWWLDTQASLTRIGAASNWWLRR
jgi:hypothetical protein